MSKLDAQRAMREARYAQRPAVTAPTPAAAPARAGKPARKRAEAPGSAADPAAPDELLCGHRAISGRTCTREQGHTAKSHRYS